MARSADIGQQDWARCRAAGGKSTGKAMQDRLMEVYAMEKATQVWRIRTLRLRKPDCTCITWFSTGNAGSPSGAHPPRTWPRQQPIFWLSGQVRLVRWFKACQPAKKPEDVDGRFSARTPEDDICPAPGRVARRLG